jgi:hypothetical protein
LGLNMTRAPGQGFPGPRGGQNGLHMHDVTQALVDYLSLSMKCMEGVTFDLNHGVTFWGDMAPVTRNRIEFMLDAGCFHGWGGGPVCSSLSSAVRPPCRSKDKPYGISNLSRANAEEGAHGEFIC